MTIKTSLAAASLVGAGIALTGCNIYPEYKEQTTESGFTYLFMNASDDQIF
ncbi:MAG: hypothetical protein ACLFR0_03230 [Alphaproteobacteria bacterium]